MTTSIRRTLSAMSLDDAIKAFRTCKAVSAFVAREMRPSVLCLSALSSSLMSWAACLSSANCWCVSFTAPTEQSSAFVGASSSIGSTRGPWGIGCSIANWFSGQRAGCGCTTSGGAVSTWLPGVADGDARRVAQRWGTDGTFSDICLKRLLSLIVIGDFQNGGKLPVCPQFASFSSFCPQFPGTVPPAPHCLDYSAAGNNNSFPSGRVADTRSCKKVLGGPSLRVLQGWGWFSLASSLGTLFSAAHKEDSPTPLGIALR
jgi:hypothetical protein